MIVRVGDRSMCGMPAHVVSGASRGWERIRNCLGWLRRWWRMAGNLECLAGLSGCAIVDGVYGAGLLVWRGSTGVWVVLIDWALGAGGEDGWARACRPGRAMG